MIYFTSNTSEVLRQGAASQSNTRELEYGHKHFLRMNNQWYIMVDSILYYRTSSSKQGTTANPSDLPTNQKLTFT